MRFITNLGPSAYVIVFLPFAFFCIDPRFGAKLALIYFLSSGIRETLAMVFCFPRPFFVDSRVDTFSSGRALTFSYSFPSGHALVGTSIWLFAASRFKRPWAWGAGLAMALLICFSRVYLGVHWPSDVTAGLVAGTILLLACLCLESPVAKWWQSCGLINQCAAAAASAGVLVSGGILAQSFHSTLQDPASWAAFAVKARDLSRVTEQAGAVLGLGIGLAMSRGSPRFAVHPSWLRRLACWFLGCACLGTIYLSRKIGPADSEMIRAIIRFAGAFLATGLMTCVVPWLCLRWKLVKPASRC